MYTGCLTVMYSSDPRCRLDDVNTRVEDRRDRVQNWELLMKNVNSFYQVRYLTCHYVFILPARLSC